MGAVFAKKEGFTIWMKIGLVLLTVSILFAILALLLDQLADVSDGDDYCGWNAIRSLTDTDFGTCSVAANYACDCDAEGADYQDYCDTASAGQWWLYSTVLALVLSIVSVVIIGGLRRNVFGAIFGFLSWFLYILGVLIWLGLVSGGDVDGNPVCDGPLGVSIYVIFIVIIVTFCGSILSLDFTCKKLLCCALWGGICGCCKGSCKKICKCCKGSCGGLCKCCKGLATGVCSCFCAILCCCCDDDDDDEKKTATSLEVGSQSPK